MPFYISTIGIIQRISRRDDGCTLVFSVMSEDQGQINILLPSDAYVLDGRSFAVGDRATFFYESNAPVPLIFPPQYRAVAAAHTPRWLTAALDVFQQQDSEGLVNSDNTLALTISPRTVQILPNGQEFRGSLSGKLLMVLFGPSTRSIPAQTTPQKLVVFCSSTPWQQ